MTTDQKITVPDLRTPCCGAELYVVLSWEGNGYTSSQFVEYIECDECMNTWRPDGRSNANNKMPGETP